MIATVTRHERRIHYFDAPAGVSKRLSLFRACPAPRTLPSANKRARRGHGGTRGHNGGTRFALRRIPHLQNDRKSVYDARRDARSDSRISRNSGIFAQAFHDLVRARIPTPCAGRRAASVPVYAELLGIHDNVDNEVRHDTRHDTRHQTT